MGLRSMAPVHANRMISTRTLLALLLLVANSALNAAVDERDPREFFFIQSFGDLPEEMQIARDEGKLGMLLFFESEACPYCHYMLRKIFNQRSVQEWYAERFVSIAVDIHGDVELTDFNGITLPSKIFSDQRKIFLTPVVSFIDLNGVEIYRHLGMVRTPEEFLLLGKYIVGEHYLDTEFGAYLKSLGTQEPYEALTTPAALEDAK
jgi:thioredoxin-related protein